MRHVFCHIETQVFVQEQILIHPRCVCSIIFYCPHNDDDNTRSISGPQRFSANILILAVHPWLKLNTFTFHGKTIAAKVDLENKDKVTEWEHRFSNLPSPSRINQICNFCIAMMIKWWCYGEVYLSLWTTLQISWHLPTLGSTAGYHQQPHQHTLNIVIITLHKRSYHQLWNLIGPLQRLVLLLFVPCPPESNQTAKY